MWFDTVEAVLAGEVVTEREDGVLERSPKIDPRTPAAKVRKAWEAWWERESKAIDRPGEPPA